MGPVSAAGRSRPPASPLHALRPVLEFKAQSIAHIEPDHLKDALAGNKLHKQNPKEANLRRQQVP